MRTTRATRMSGLLTLLSAAGIVSYLALAAFPIEAEAQVNCDSPTTADADGDGLSDLVECAGIGVGATPLFSFATGLTLPGGETSIARCPAPPISAAVRPTCLDPNSKDFFVDIVRATTAPPPSGTWIPANPAQFISKALSQGGLAITVHELTEGAGVAPDRLVLASGSSAHYLIVSESLAPATADNDDLGVANQGTPGSPFAFATAFTQRIVDYHAGVYTSAGGLAPAEERDAYILHTIAHEISHNLDLCACPDNPRYGGRHYKTGTVVIMEQSVKVTIKGNTVTFFISDDYPSADQAGADVVP